jgi:hypothetical protein
VTINEDLIEDEDCRIVAEVRPAKYKRLKESLQRYMTGA